MPTNSYPITVAAPTLDRMLTVEVTYTALPDIAKSLDIIVINGTLVNALPFQYTPGSLNELQIVNITGTTVFIVFSDPVDLTMEFFEVVNAKLFTYERNDTAPLLQKYAPLNNFYDGTGDLNDDRNYNTPFKTVALNLLENSILDLKLQPAYDGSVNLIWTDDNNPMRIVNTRFAVNETGTEAQLIDRRARKDANTYNEVNFHQTELIPKAVGIATVTFNGLVPGGILPGGGYRYFFKYITADGAETDIIEESRLVSVHEGATTLNAVGSTGLPTPNAVSFSLSNLDQSFYGVVVYYTISVGMVDSVDKALKINDPYIIENGGTCTIVHTGYENSALINIETLSLTYSTISRSRTLDVVNNRLLVGNTDTEDIYDQTLAEAAAYLKIQEAEFDIIHHSKIDSSTNATAESNYSNPLFIYNNLGYWKGETAELGIVFVTKSGLSPVYTLQGIDNADGSLAYVDNLLGGLYRGYSANGQNSMGIYRTEDIKDLWDYDADKLYFKGTKLQVDISILGTLTDVEGFFFVRRPRKKDVLMQGLITPVAAVPIETKFGAEYEISGFGNWCGVGVTSDVAGGNVKFVPAPGGMMPFGVEEVAGNTTAYSVLQDSAGKDVVTVGSFSGAVVTLSSIDGVDAGDSLKFVGYVVGTVLTVDSGSSKVTLTAVPASVPIAGTIVQIGKKGTGTSTDFYTKAPIKDYGVLKSWALYSPDTECAPTYYASLFSGSKVGLSCGKQAFTTEQINTTLGHEAPLNVVTPLYHRITSAQATYDANTALIGDRSAYASYIDTGAVGVAPKGFSGSMDRNLFLYWGYAVGQPALTAPNICTKIDGATQFASGCPMGKELSYRPGNALSYGRYVGLKLEGSAVDEFEDLSMTFSNSEHNKHAFNSLSSVGGWLDAGLTTDTSQLGYVISVYSSPTGNILGLESWKSRYIADEDTEYIAITKRFRYSDYFGTDPLVPSTLIDIYGGDCFLGLSWKQVWHPMGIAEAPQTNDVTAYKTTRRSLGLLSYGYAIPVPAQSNYNFNVRSKERVDEREYKVYGTDRSFLPIKGKDSIRCSRQFETGAYNHGYNAVDRSAYRHFRLNLNAPFYRFKYPNRVYVSSESSENEFVNGFANFKGLNYRDYNSDLGSVTKLIALNNVLMAVYKDGVAQIGVDERSQLSSDTGGVFVDSAQILSRANVLNSSYGCSHLNGVCASNNYVYAVDFGRKKIWRTNGQQGAAFEIISDLKIQNKLGSISKELTDLVTTSPTSWLDVFSHFDSKKNEIYFTFTVRDPVTPAANKTRTIVFNESLNLWVCETDDTRKFVFQSNDGRYAFPCVVGKFNRIYKYGIIRQAKVDPTIDVYGEYNKFYDTIYNMSYDYHVVDEQSLYKMFTNIYIVGNNSLPSKVTYISDFNSMTEQELKSYTNVRYPMVTDTGDPFIINGVGGTQILDISSTPATIIATQRMLSYGDFISIVDVDDPHIVYRYVVIAYNPGSSIIVDKNLPLTGFSNLRLYFGYPYPLRLADSSFEESYGVISCQFNNRSTRGMSPAKLRGKWMRFKHTYEGTAPVYISGIITDYGISLS
jgi:hypothetical protein